MRENLTFDGVNVTRNCIIAVRYYVEGVSFIVSGERELLATLSKTQAKQVNSYIGGNLPM